LPAIMMVPTVTRTTEEMLMTVRMLCVKRRLPGHSKWRTILSVSLRTASPASSRLHAGLCACAGETAPLLSPPSATSSGARA